MKLYYCDWCRTRFKDYPSQRRGKTAFCSLKCKYQWNQTLQGYWKGKKMPESAKKKMKLNHADFSGSKNGRWNGGRILDKDGYILVLEKNHPNADYHGYVREHRLIMEKKLGRYLLPTEVIHHVNHKKNDNREENLILISSGSEHQKIHYHNGDSKHLKNYTP